MSNDNRMSAGTLVNGVLTVALELRPSVWRPNGDSGVAIPVAAFAEAGKPATIPGPLVRVVAGTELRVSLHNFLDVRAVLHGLRDHDGTADSLALAPGEARDIRFTAHAIGTPHTERLSYIVGDTVRWRVINASQHGHPMHLHGLYFSVLSHGTPVDDTLYDAESRHNAVTELMPVVTTMTLQWVPDRAGNWLYHCHFMNHVDTDIRLADSPPATKMGASHTHLMDGMSGLVMAISVRDTIPAQRAKRPASPRRRFRLFVTERASLPGAQPSYADVLQQGAREPAADSMRLPGSTLVLNQGEPAQITVINHARHATVVHWHGMELESYYDGVAGWSGADALTAPLIAPGDSFVVKLTPPRAGTFIYHTHADDLSQLTGGLYGALLVLPAHAKLDASDHPSSSRTRPPPTCTTHRRLSSTDRQCRLRSSSAPVSRTAFDSSGSRPCRDGDCACSMTPRSYSGNCWPRTDRSCHPCNRSRRPLPRDWSPVKRWTSRFRHRTPATTGSRTPLRITSRD